jgi:hypothetical protein
MNYFGFDPILSVAACMVAVMLGLFAGNLLGFVRYILFSFMEGKIPFHKRKEVI